MTNQISISQLTETAKVSLVSKRVFGLCFLMMLADGYDTSSLSFAVPTLIRDWNIPKVAMGSVFSVQLFGLMIGAIVFGYIGDRFGRKTAIVSGTILFGVSSLVTAFASDLTYLYLIRFIVGLGVGGAVPNAISLCNEYSPQRYRVTVVALIFAGFTFGSSGGGFVSAWLLPHYGWQIVFQIGGFVPIIIAIVLWFWLPESIKYLALKEGGSPRTQQIAARMRPELPISVETIIVPDAEPRIAKPFKLRELFEGERKFMTPLLWLLYIANSMATFALISWMPALMETSGLSPGKAALAGSCLSIGGAIGGLIAGRGIDRYGLAIFCALPALACVTIGPLGYVARMGEVELMTAVFFGGFCVLGAQNCLHGVSGSIYPTGIRANGVGWALGIAKVGSMTGPLVAGLLLSLNVSIQQMFIAATVPLLVAFAAAVALLGFYNLHIYRTSQSRQEAGWRPTLEQV